MGQGHHSCGVAVCRNTSINAKKRGLVIHFFRFPQDSIIKKKWIVKCSRADKNFNPNNARICSDHFTVDDYEDSLKARLMGKTPIKLKKTAIPTLLLHPSEPRKQPKPSIRQVGRKKLKDTISQLIDEDSNQELMPIPEVTPISSHLSGKIKSLEEEELNLIKKLKKNEESVPQKTESLIKENKELKKRFASKPNNILKSPSSKKTKINKQSYDMELERRVSQFIASKVQIIVAELL